MLFTALLTGFLFSLSLIVAIGAQNIYVLQQGARRAHVGTVVAICSVSDAALIAVGVAGMGALISAQHGLLTAVRILGAALLLAYGALAARRAIRPSAGPLAAGATAASRSAVIAATLAFTWLNPAVFLDTIVLLGSVADAHHSTRWWFAAGAASASALWFICVGYGARLLGPALRRPGAARFLDGFVAVVMVITALRTLPL